MTDRTAAAAMAGNAPATERIGFVGLGRMGFPMARNIAQAGWPLTVFDIRAETAQRLAESHGAEVATSLTELAGCTVVITMLPSSREVEAVLCEAEGNLSSVLAPGALVIDCSSSDPLVTRRLGPVLRGCGLGLVDAPVAGGVVFAEDGTLDLLVGGDEADVARAEPVLKLVGKTVHRCGALGSGHAMKILNNFVNAAALVTYAEAMALGAAAGLDGEVVLRSLESATTGRNHPFEKKILKQVVSGKFASGMALELIHKDVSLVGGLGRHLGAWTPVADLTAELWAKGCADVGRSADQTRIVELWNRRGGVAPESGSTGAA